MKSERTKIGSKFGMVMIPELNIDPEVQRKLSKQWVKEHQQEFDVDQLGYIVVNRRDGGKLYIIDGMHRVELMRAVGWGDQKIHAEIFEGLTQAEEAELFNARNDRRAVRRYDRFRISFTARDPQAVEITQIVHRSGFAISDQAVDGNVVAIDALERIFAGGGIASAREGAAALKRTLDVLRDAFGKSAAAVHGDMIRALGLVHLRYGVEIDHKGLVTKLASFSGCAPGIIGRGRSLKELRGRPLYHCIASIIVDAYNKGRRSGKIDSWESE